MTTKNERLRKAVITGHRKRMGLCLICGKDIHDSTCNSDFTRADTRIKEVVKKPIDIERKMRSIVSYRKKKNLCIYCGLEPHNDKCIPIYNKTDNRCGNEKNSRPAIISSPKNQYISILDTIQQTQNKRVNLKPKNKIQLQRDFIVLDIRPSSTDKRVEYSCIRQLSQKFKDYIICVIGSLKKYFSYGDYLKIKKLTNILEINSIDEQVIVDYICSSKKCLGYDDRYTDVCLNHHISFYCFPPNVNATSKLADVVFSTLE